MVETHEGDYSRVLRHVKMWRRWMIVSYHVCRDRSGCKDDWWEMPWCSIYMVWARLRMCQDDLFMRWCSIPMRWDMKTMREYALCMRIPCVDERSHSWDALFTWDETSLDEMIHGADREECHGGRRSVLILAPEEHGGDAQVRWDARKMGDPWDDGGVTWIMVWYSSWVR